MPPPPSKKRKRDRGKDGGEHEAPAKQRRRPSNDKLQTADAVKHTLLARYYPKIVTLRQYLLDNLPATSKIRRRKIEASKAAGLEQAQNTDTVRAQIAKLLDTTLVGLHSYSDEVAKARSENHLQQWIEYSQKDDSHVTLSRGHASAIHSQSEVGLYPATLAGAREADYSAPDC